MITRQLSKGTVAVNGKGFGLGKGKRITAYGSMSKNLMYYLFDLGQLIIDSKDKLKVFKNEIGNIMRKHEENMDKVNFENSNDEKLATLHELGLDLFLFRYNNEKDIYTYFKNTKERKISHETVLEDVAELLNFMFHGDETTVCGFLQRAYRVADIEYQAHYGKRNKISNYTATGKIELS
jgi:hypothetical protein